MKKCYLFVFFFLVLLDLDALAQTNGNNFSLPTILPPAPQSAALGRYDDIPVSINTGVPNISLPFFTVNSGKLSLPVSISYHSSGVKVSDMASPSGLGWALNAGGDITRSVQGQPDESTYGFSTVFMPNANDPSLAAKEKCLANNMNNPYDASINAWDGQPDLFFFSAGNKSGQFLLKNNVSNYQGMRFMTIPYYPINISVSSNFQTFTIVDDDGTQYFFNRADSTSTTSSTTSRTITSATAWHLVKIRSADKADSIVLQYNTVSHFGYTSNLSQNLQLHYDSYGNPSYINYSNATNSTIATTEYLLSEIDFKNGKVTFDYGAAYASTQTMILNAAHLYNISHGNYKEIKRYTLYHSQFVNGSTSTNVSRLDSVQQTGYYNGNVVKQPSTAFTYISYAGYQCPPFNSFGQDFWGYFNGQAGNTDMNFVVAGTTPGSPSFPVATTSAAKRLPDSNYMQVGTLQSIRYPTGGQTTLTLEANRIAVPATQNQLVSNPPTGLNVYISNFGASVNSTAGFSSNFTVNTTPAYVFYQGSVAYNAKLTFQISPMCASGSSNCIYDQAFVQVNDITSGTPGAIVTQLSSSSPSSSNPTTLTALFNVTQGHTYVLSFPYQPVLPNNSSNFQYRLDANVQSYNSSSDVDATQTITLSPICLTGGLRVKTLTSTDGSGHSLIKQYSYTGTYFNSPLFSGDYTALANTFSFKGNGLGGGSGQGVFVLSLTTYSPNLSLSLGSASNNSVSYNEVVEYESDGNGNYNGKSVYDYNTAQDVITMQMPFFRISNETARGLLTQKRVYKLTSSGYSLIKNTVNNYSNLDSAMTTADTCVFYTAHTLYQASGGSVPGQTPSLPAYDCLGCTVYSTANQFLINRYYYTTSRYVLKSTSVTDYDNNGNTVTKTISSDYQNPLHCYPTHTNMVNSDGKSKDSYSSYVLDQTLPSGCTNSCAVTLQTQLASINSTYFPQFASAYTKYSQFENSNGTYAVSNGALTGVLTTVQQDSVINYENVYAQLMTNYQSAIDAAVNSYNSCSTTYNTCLSNFYSTATTDQQGIMDLLSQNNIAPVIQSTHYTNGVLNSTQQNYFQSFYTGVTKPSRVMFSTMANSLETRLVYNQYDLYGNNIVAQKADGPFQSYLWDYQNSLPIADVQNASTADIAYTSFEADGSGNWTIASAARDTLTPALTGSQSYLLSNGSITKSGLTAGTTYVISYWRQNGTAIPSITGNLSGYPITGPTRNGWTYYEHHITGVTSITLSGTGNIDELRCYPVNALMTTYTFDPLVGPTSITDPKNETTYYEYDGLQRLLNVKDKDGNIIKSYGYHYQGQ